MGRSKSRLFSRDLPPAPPPLLLCTVFTLLPSQGQLENSFLPPRLPLLSPSFLPSFPPTKTSSLVAAAFTRSHPAALRLLYRSRAVARVSSSSPVVPSRRLGSPAAFCLETLNHSAACPSHQANPRHPDLTGLVAWFAQPPTPCRSVDQGRSPKRHSADPESAPF